MRLPSLPASELPEQDHIEATVDALSQPADPAWIMLRVAALLSPYYEKDTPQAVKVMEAEDWLEALAPYPQWIIERAVRWWRSAKNENRRKRPLEGDIEALCHEQCEDMRAIPRLTEHARRRAKVLLNAPSPEPPKARVSPEAVAAIMNEVGFRFRSNRHDNALEPEELK